MRKLVLSFLFVTMASSAYAQTCRTIRECTMLNSRLQQKVDQLTLENYRLVNELNTCRLNDGPIVNEHQFDLLLNLHTNRFVANNNKICGSTTCGKTDLLFIFENDTLKVQMETKGSSWSIRKQVVNVVVPDKYGEFVQLPHPSDVDESKSTQCKYMVSKDADGKIEKLELFQEIIHYTTNCPDRYVRL